MTAFERFMADIRVRAATPPTPWEMAAAAQRQRLASMWSLVPQAAGRPSTPPPKNTPGDRMTFLQRILAWFEAEQHDAINLAEVTYVMENVRDPRQ